jgi:hypothetical protein
MLGVCLMDLISLILFFLTVISLILGSVTGIESIHP